MTEESWEDWAKRQPKEYHDALKITRSFEEKREKETKRSEEDRAKKLLGTYWREYENHYMKVIGVDGMKIKYIEIHIGKEEKTITTQFNGADNPWIGRFGTQRQLTKDEFHKAVDSSATLVLDL